MANQLTSIVPAFLDDAKTIKLPAGATVFQAGQPCDKFLFVVSGSVRVDLHSISGKSIMLYRIGPSQSCDMTTSCLIAGRDEATTETETVACALPIDKFEARLNSSSDFRAFVFEVFTRRLGDMMAKVEQVAFSPLDQRLAKRIAEVSSQNPLVHITHEQLATDLGSSREVISRRLAKWEDYGLIERGHRSLLVIKPSEIERLAGFGD